MDVGSLDADPQGRADLRARAADDKSGLASTSERLKAFDGKPPCTVRVIVEGMEETDSNLEGCSRPTGAVRLRRLRRLRHGNLRVGEPTVTTALRGDVACIVTVRTLEHPLHSGEFGGPTPDAMVALARLLASLHDDEGNVAIEACLAWHGADIPAEDFRASAAILDGVELTGSGSLGSRLWSEPSVSAIGVDMTTVEGSSNV